MNPDIEMTQDMKNMCRYILQLAKEFYQQNEAGCSGETHAPDQESSITH